jgi:hypothetical protein
VLLRQAKALAVQPAVPAVTPRYKREQWIESFEGQLAILRPHLTYRVLGSKHLQAWHQRGTKGEDPIGAAKVWAASLDKPKARIDPRESLQWVWGSSRLCSDKQHAVGSCRVRRSGVQTPRCRVVESHATKRLSGKEARRRP